MFKTARLKGNNAATNCHKQTECLGFYLLSGFNKKIINWTWRRDGRLIQVTSEGHSSRTVQTHVCQLVSCRCHLVLFGGCCTEGLHVALQIRYSCSGYLSRGVCSQLMPLPLISNSSSLSRPCSRGFLPSTLQPISSSTDQKTAYG